MSEQQPDITVSFEDKVVLFRALLGQLADALASKSADNAFTADDYLDFLSLAAGAMLANDTNLTTPRAFRLGAEVFAKKVEGYAKGLRKAQEDGDMPSLFQQALDDHRT